MWRLLIFLPWLILRYLRQSLHRAEKSCATLVAMSWLQPTVVEAKDEQNYQRTNEEQRELGIKGLGSPCVPLRNGPR